MEQLRNSLSPEELAALAGKLTAETPAEEKETEEN